MAWKGLEALSLEGCKRRGVRLTSQFAGRRGVETLETLKQGTQLGNPINPQYSDTAPKNIQMNTDGSHKLRRSIDGWADQKGELERALREASVFFS